MVIRLCKNNIFILISKILHYLFGVYIVDKNTYNTHPYRDETCSVRLVRKLVQVVRHAAELADIIRMLRREPFLHLPVPHTTAQELPGGYACAPCLAFQRVVVRCRHLHHEAVFQLVCRSLLGAASIVSVASFPFLFH